MIGAQIDNYRIVEKIGDGGMGSVYKAVDVMLERDVALKFLRPELARQPDLVSRFRAEAIVLARLNHQNIAALYGLHRHGDDFFMAMEYVPGETLEAMLRRSTRLPIDQAVALGGQVLQALDYAHKSGVVHRDIKSANIVVTPASSVKVMDFGIARVLGTERHTRVGFVVGTIGYMAPEQIQGLDVDGRTDIYALGVVLYEMLTGRMPFQGDTEFAVMQAQVQQMPVPPRVFAEVPVPVENTVMRALAKQPHERFQTAAEFHAALHASLRHSAAYAVAQQSALAAPGDETREFKSDPNLPAAPPPAPGTLPHYPIPPSGPHAAPTPLGTSARSGTQPAGPPIPGPIGATTPDALVARPATGPTLPAPGTALPPARPPLTGGGAPVARPSTPGLGYPAPPSSAEGWGDLPTGLTPVPGPPPAAPAVEVPPGTGTRAADTPPPPPVAPAAASAAPKAAAKAPAPKSAKKAARKPGRAPLLAFGGVLVVLAALAGLGYFAWQRIRPAEPVIEQAVEPIALVPPVAMDVPIVMPDAGPFIVAALVPLPASGLADAAAARAGQAQPPPGVQPSALPTPVAPVAIPEAPPAPGLPEAPAPGATKAATPPAMFGGVKWFRPDGSKVREVDVFMQITDNEVRLLDRRAQRATSVPYSVLTHAVHSQGKRPRWRTNVGPQPFTAGFDETMRTFHYVAFQGPSQFLLVRIDRDDLPRLRQELQSRASLTLESM